MFSFAPQLRFFIVLLLGGLLAACSQHATEECPLCHRVDPNQSVCGSADNIAVCFFADAIIQDDSPLGALREALRDAVNLPLEELRAKRYEGRMGEPEKRTFVDIISDYFTGVVVRKNGEYEDSRSKGFIEAVKQPEAKATMERMLADLEEGIRQDEAGN